MTHPNDDENDRADESQPFRLDLTQDEFDREFFGRILAHGVGNTDVLRRQAELLARAGDYASALELDQQLAARCPEEHVVFYNLACSLSMTGESQAALKALKTAISLGYCDFAHIEADSDLDPLRDLPAFAELIRRRLADDDDVCTL